MWRMLRTELRYNAIFLIPSFLSMTFMSTAGFFLELDSSIFSTFTLMIYISVFTVLAIRLQNEKRERFYAVLPVTLATMGTTRILLLLIVYSGLSVPWLLSFFMGYSILQDDKFWTSLASNFLILNSLMFALIQYDLLVHPVKRYRAIFLSSVALYFVLLMSLVAVVVLVGKKQAPELASIFLNWPKVALCIIPTPFSIYLSVIFFTKRTSFLDKRTC